METVAAPGQDNCMGLTRGYDLREYMLPFCSHYKVSFCVNQSQSLFWRLRSISTPAL